MPGLKCKTVQSISCTYGRGKVFCSLWFLHFAQSTWSISIDCHFLGCLSLEVRSSSYYQLPWLIVHCGLIMSFTTVIRHFLWLVTHWQASKIEIILSLNSNGWQSSLPELLQRPPTYHFSEKPVCYCVHFVSLVCVTALQRAACHLFTNSKNTRENVCWISR